MNRILLTDHQCRLFTKDLIEFGYTVTFEEVRKIADQVHEGTHSELDPVARIMCNHIDEAMEMRSRIGKH